MSRTIKVNASILCADFNHLAADVQMCEDAGVDMVHVDVMDGHFVPVISMGPIVVEAVRKITQLPIETHLMIENPGRFIPDFIAAGADIVSIHAECYGQRREHCRAFDQYPKEIDLLDAEAARADIQLIKSHGKKAHMVLNPGTPVCIEPVLDVLDGVLVMSVNPGFAKTKIYAGRLGKSEKDTLCL
jgi:ribulose-phosphate 3-epimerase